MGTCISKPAELPGAADKKKVLDNEVKPVASAPAAKGSDRSLQRLFDKDVHDDDHEEANGQLKRIPEEDSADEQEELQVTERASTLETIVENKQDDEAGKAKDQQVGAADEVEKRELELPVTKEDTAPVAPAEEIRSSPPAAELSKEPVEERPSTPEISESKLVPGEVVNECQVSDNVGEEQHQQAQDNNVELAKQESDMFDLLLKQASEKFEIPGVPADQAVVTAGVPEASVDGVAAARSINEDVDTGKPSEITQEAIEDTSAGQETPHGVNRPVETEMAIVKPHPDKAANGEGVAVLSEQGGPAENVEIPDVPAQDVPEAYKDVGGTGPVVNEMQVEGTGAQVVPSEAESEIAAEATSVTRHADKPKSKEEDAEVVDGPSEQIEPPEAVTKSSEEIAAPTESMSDMSVSEAAPMENEPEQKQQQEIIVAGAPATGTEPAQAVENDIAEEAKSEAPTKTSDGEQASTKAAVQSDHDSKEVEPQVERVDTPQEGKSPEIPQEPDSKEVESQIERVDTPPEGNGPENPQEANGEKKDEAEQQVGKEESDANISKFAPEATCEAGSAETYAGQSVASAPAEGAAPIEPAVAAEGKI